MDKGLIVKEITNMKTLFENMFERHPELYRTQEEHDREDAENQKDGTSGYDEYNEDDKI